MEASSEDELTSITDKKGPDESAEVTLFDFCSKQVKKLTLAEASSGLFIKNHKLSLVYIRGISKPSIDFLFTRFKIRPLIQTECSEWSFKDKDTIMSFDNCIFLSLSDFPCTNDLETIIQLKFIIFPTHILALSSELAYFIHYIQQNTADFSGEAEDAFDSPGEVFLLPITNRPKREKRVKFSDCDSIQSILFRIFKIMVNRYENLVLLMRKECNNCMNFSVEIGYKEKAEYQIRLNKAEKNLEHLKLLISGKIDVFKAICAAYAHTDFGIYMKALAARVRNLVNIIKNSFKILGNAKALYKICAEDTLTRISFSSGELMRFYSGLTTVIVPLLLMEGLWSTNIMIPGGDQADLKPFEVMVGCTAVWILLCLAYFRKIQWI